jgi:hypothetical protein
MPTQSHFLFWRSSAVLKHAKSLEALGFCAPNSLRSDALLTWRGQFRCTSQTHCNRAENLEVKSRTEFKPRCQGSLG